MMSEYHPSLPLSGGRQDLLGAVTSVTTYNKDEAISDIPKVASNGLGDTAANAIDLTDDGNQASSRTDIEPDAKASSREQAKYRKKLERQARRRIKKQKDTAIDFHDVCRTARQNARHNKGAAYGSPSQGATISTEAEAFRTRNWANPSKSIYGKAYVPDRLERAPPTHVKANYEAILKLETRFLERLAVILEWERLRPDEAFWFERGLLPALAELASHNGITDVGEFQGHLRSIVAERGPKVPGRELTKERVEKKDTQLSMEQRTRKLMKDVGRIGGIYASDSADAVVTVGAATVTVPDTDGATSQSL